MITLREAAEKDWQWLRLVIAVEKKSSCSGVRSVPSLDLDNKFLTKPRRNEKDWKSSLKGKFYWGKNWDTKLLAKALRHKIVDRNESSLISFWQEFALVEAGEASIGPHAFVSSRVVVTAGNATAETITFAQLFQVVVGDEASFVIEKTQANEDATNVARGDALSRKDTLMIFVNGSHWNAQLGNAFLASGVQVLAGLHDVFSWNLLNGK